MQADTAGAEHPASWSAYLVAGVGALLSTVALTASGVPGALWAVPLQDSSVAAVLAFVGILACGVWVLRTAERSVWLWAGPLGAIIATAETVGSAQRGYDRVGVVTDYPVWTATHWLGVAWLVAGAVAALIALVDRVVAGTAGSSDSTVTRFMARLQDVSGRRRAFAVLIVAAAVALSRVLAFVLWWPGVVAFDSFRSYAYVRGATAWDAYEPVGRSLQIAGTEWLGNVLGLGDTGGVALSIAGQLVVDVAACTLLLVRLSAWGAGRRLWLAALAWMALSPVLVMSSVVMVKDVPFTTCLTFFAVAIGELIFAKDAARKWWPWVTLAVAGVAAISLRNNGIYVVGLSLLLLLIPLRRSWKRVLGTIAVLAVAFGLYSGPLYQTLDIQPGPKAETWSVPIQQMARIARDHAGELTPEEREFLTQAFDGATPEAVGELYIPEISDPAKAAAREAWESHSATTLLGGWVGLALRFPVTAVEATLATTVGYWDPGSAPYEMLPVTSSNDVRGIHLEIPSGENVGAFQSWIIDSGLIPTHGRYAGTENDGYYAIPVIGRLAAPGFIAWLWVIAAVAVIRRRNWTSLAVFIPYGVLMLTLMAGPVSSQRYMLPFYAALPLAAAAMVLTPVRRSRWSEKSDDFEEPAADRVEPPQPSPAPAPEPEPHTKSENQP